MDYITEKERRTLVVADVDLLVCGGGFAGVAAAVSARRIGAEVMVLEKYGFLGGLCTSALVITTPPLNNGINIEISERLKKKSVFIPCRHSGDATDWLEMRSLDPEILKYEFLQMLHEEGVDILMHTYIVGTIMEENTVKGVIMENKAGRQAVLAKMVVDTTGDADIAAYANSPHRVVKKPMTMMYNMVGVDVGKALEKIGNWSNLKKFVKEAIDKGQLTFDLGTTMEFGAPGVHAEELVYQGELNVWSGNLHGMSGIDPQDLTKAEFITREHVMRLTSFLKDNIPGFENSRIECTSTQVGVRASRQIEGEAAPSIEQATTIKFHDTVAKPYKKNEMRLPYGSILPRNVENLLVAGRCISAEESSMGLMRLIPVCSATGQAAGTAAALALNHGVTPRRLDVSILQKVLEEEGNMNLGLRE